MADITLAETIAQSLAADIINGQLRAGQRLDEQTIAERFEVSRSPVRDALRRLATTHLIEYASRRGFSVTELEPTHLQDMYDALGEIEGVCAKFCALRANTADRLTIEKIHAAMRAESPSPQIYAALNEDFHNAIYAGAHNHTIATIAVDVRRRLAPFRSKLFFQESRVVSSIAEHTQILNAILAYDADAAMKAMRNHTASTALNVLELANGPRAQASDLHPPKLEARSVDSRS
jgi:DNA-binding GntR family transcriptional regulator